MNHDIRVRFWQACAIFALVAGSGADVAVAFENEDAVGEIDQTLVEPRDARPGKLIFRGEQLSLIEDRPFDRSQFDEILRIKLDEFVQLLFARIPEFKLTPIFDEAQWPVVREVLDGFRSHEALLIERALIAEEPADAQQAENQGHQPNRDQPATKKEG